MSNYENFNRDVSPIYFFLNLAGIVLTIDPSGAICLGYTIDESIGQPIFNLFYPQDRTNLQAGLVECVRYPTNLFKRDYSLVCKDGSILPVRTTAQVLQGIDVRLNILLVCEPTSGRQQDRFLWQVQEGRGTPNAAVSPSVLGKTEVDSQFLYVSSAFCNFTSFNESELQARIFMEIIHPDDRETAWSSYQRLVWGEAKAYWKTAL